MGLCAWNPSVLEAETGKLSQVYEANQGYITRQRLRKTETVCYSASHALESWAPCVGVWEILWHLLSNPQRSSNASLPLAAEALVPPLQCPLHTGQFSVQQVTRMRICHVVFLACTSAGWEQLCWSSTVTGFARRQGPGHLDSLQSVTLVCLIHDILLVRMPEHGVAGQR